MRRTVFLLAVAAAAQTSYSPQSADQLAAAKDWAGLRDYAKAWAAAQPANATAWFDLGRAYAFGLHDNASASEAFAHAVALNAQWAEAWNLLGCTYALRGDFAKAIPAFRHAAETAPQKPAYWTNLQAAYRQSADAKSAEESLDRGVAASAPYAKARDWYLFANAYAKLDRPTRAIELYNKAIAMKKFPEALNNRGVAEQAEGQWRLALSDYQEANALVDPVAYQNAAALKAKIDEIHRKQTPVAKVTKALSRDPVERFPKSKAGVAHVEADFVIGDPGR